MEKHITKEALQALERLGIAVRHKLGRPPKGLAPGEEIWVLGTAEDAPQVLAGHFRGATTPDPTGGGLGLPRLWIADCIEPAAAERLIARGDGYVDAEGNAHIQVGQIFVHVQGKRRPQQRKVHGEPTQRTWRRPAIRALFQLLCNPPLGERPIREIATMGGTAPGTIVQLLNDLELMGNLVRLGGHKRRFIPDGTLVDLWIAEYQRKLRPKLLKGRFAATNPVWWKAFEPTKHRAVWGGEVAAMLLHADLRPGVKTLYARDDVTVLLRAVKLRADPEGDVELRHAFWEDIPNAPRNDITHPLLVIADLLATKDGRCREAAEHIRERYLDGLVR